MTYVNRACLSLKRIVFTKFNREWNTGRLEYWVALYDFSIIPIFQHSKIFLSLKSPSFMKTLVQQQTEYNLWANERIAAVLKSLDPKLVDVDLKSSFPSLRKTVHHIWDAEMIWLSRLEDTKLTWPPTAHFKDPAIDEFLKTSSELLNFVGSKSEEYFHTDTSFTDSKGVGYKMNNAGILMHVMNHSTFHRGQLVTMMRELGVTELPSTDLIKFLREGDKAKI